MKNLHFLSGLQRSGSTVLTKILNQHPDIYCSATSPFLDYLLPAVEQLHNIKLNHPSGNSIDISKILSTSAFSFFSTEKSNIIDKNRGWIHNYLNIHTELQENPKIILTLRPIEDVITSFHTILSKNGNVQSPEQIYIGYVQELFGQLIDSAIHKDNLCIVTYDDITLRTIDTLIRIENFLELSNHNYDLNNIIDTEPENDSKWGIDGLHDIRSNISRISINPESIMNTSELEFCRQLTKTLYQAYGLIL